MRQKVTVEILEGSTATGDKFSAGVERRAKVDAKDRLIRVEGERDRAAGHLVVLDPDLFVPVGSKLTVWKGTPNEHTGIVRERAYLEDTELPSHYVLKVD